MNWLEQSALIVLGVLIPGAILAGPRLYRKRKENRKAQEAKEQMRDDLLQNISTTLTELAGDVKELYTAMPAQFEALEVALRALHGEKVNGNVDKALASIDAAKKRMNKRLVDKVG